MKKILANADKHHIHTAILVDGGFYRKRAKKLYGEKSPKDRAEELNDYCLKHLLDKYEHRYLYRIFYYDFLQVTKILLALQTYEYHKTCKKYGTIDEMEKTYTHRKNSLSI